MMRLPGSARTATHRVREMKAAARARSNIALVKYWGKRDKTLNLPAVGSISITLDALWSDTQIEFDATLDRDYLELDGKSRAAELERVSSCLDILRARAGVGSRARVISSNNFPTAAGLASSASGFAALVAAADRALDLNLSKRELSIVARRGSGSAARSIYGGFVEMHRGDNPDGTDSFAEPMEPPEYWPLEVLVGITSTVEKDVSSGQGMQASARASAYYDAWVSSHAVDMALARAAIRARDFSALADVSEQSCLKMHAAALATRPPLIYWNGTTVEGMKRIRSLRSSGVPVFFTIDAGPQLKAICEPAYRGQVLDALRDTPGIADVIVSGIGGDVEAR